MHDSEQAEDYLTRARRLEESYAHHKALSLNDLPFGARLESAATHMDDQDGMVSVRFYGPASGEILTANGKAAMLLGMQKMEVVGRMLHTLFPPPICDWVQLQLDTFQATGDCFFIDNPILLPLLTSVGALLPALVHLKESPPENGGDPPALVLQFKAVSHTNEIALFAAEVS